MRRSLLTAKSPVPFSFGNDLSAPIQDYSSNYLLIKGDVGCPVNGIINTINWFQSNSASFTFFTLDTGGYVKAIQSSVSGGSGSGIKQKTLLQIPINKDEYIGIWSAGYQPSVSISTGMGITWTYATSTKPQVGNWFNMSNFGVSTYSLKMNVEGFTV